MSDKFSLIVLAFEEVGDTVKCQINLKFIFIPSAGS